MLKYAEDGSLFSSAGLKIIAVLITIVCHLQAFSQEPNPCPPVNICDNARLTEQEHLFVEEAPKFMQAFSIFSDSDKMSFIRDQNKAIPPEDISPKACATRELFKIFLNPTTNPNNFLTKLSIICLLSQINLPQSFEQLGLTRIEAFAVYTYSTEDYKLVNQDLRKESPSSTGVAYRTIINQALLKFPIFFGVVKRGCNIPKSKISQFQEGAIVKFNAFTSTTADLTLGAFERHHRLIIHSKKGRDISFFSANPPEREVLFAAGTHFKVLHKTPNVVLNGRTAEFEFELEEIE